MSRRQTATGVSDASVDALSRLLLVCTAYAHKPPAIAPGTNTNPGAAMVVTATEPTTTVAPTTAAPAYANCTGSVGSTEIPFELIWLIELSKSNIIKCEMY